jgi:Leucine-rich repeat (LRR) protein
MKECKRLFQIHPYLIFVVIIIKDNFLSSVMSTPLTPGVLSKCSFNNMCSCSPENHSLPEVHCFSAPFVSIPSLPDKQHFYRVSIIGSPDIHDMPPQAFNGSTVSSFTLTGSRLSEIDDAAFAGNEETLTTLDLSENQLRTFPTFSLSRLKLLQWLSLKGNVIEEVKARDVTLGDTSSSPGHDRRISHDSEAGIERQGLRTLLLSDNRLSVVHDSVFSHLSHLQSLDLAGNMITRVEGRPFPASLTSLSLSHNLLEVIPVHALSNLVNLRWLQMRGNLVKNLPSSWFLPTNKIDILDLSHNLLERIPRRAFLATQDSMIASSTPTTFSNLKDEEDERYVSIGDFHLDFNLIQDLDSGSFSNLSIKRLSMSNNKLSSLPDDVFAEQLESKLQALDLNFNLLSSYPTALKRLQRITSVFVRGNQLHVLPEDAFMSCKDSLQSLDLSSNSFVKLPFESLRSTTRILRLNLQDNLITSIEEGQLGKWASSLLSLSLSKNNLQLIASTSFKNTKSLKELRLSFNDLDDSSLESLFPLRHTLVILELTSALHFPSIGDKKESSFFLDPFAALTQEPDQKEQVDKNYFLGNNNKRLFQSLSNLHSLEWLELDLNSLRFLPLDFMKNLSSLIHLDLEGNSISRLPKDFFSGKSHSKQL